MKRISKRHTPARRHHACPLIELLVVLIIASILMSLLYTVVTKSRSRSLEVKAKAEAVALDAAISSYRTANGIYPCQTQGTHDTFYLLDNLRVVNVLASPDPRGKVHLRVPPSAITNTFYHDPWGYPYAICMDETGDGYLKGFDGNIEPAYRNLPAVNIATPDNPKIDETYRFSIVWVETNNAVLGRNVAVFSLQGVGRTMSGPGQAKIRSW